MADRMTAQFDNCRLIFKNFAGDEGPFNKKGDKNFSVVIPDEATAQAMAADGWNVKWPKPRPDLEEEDTRQPRLPCFVRYDPIPPNIWVITSKARTRLTEETVEMLDYADIEKIDLIVNGSKWSIPDSGSGIKAYVKTMFVTLNEDPLELRYAVAADENQGSGGGED